jgi:flagellar basal-body rod modification protein FlgD
MSVSPVTKAAAVQPSAAAASGSGASGAKTFEDLMASMRTDGAAAAAGADPKLTAGTDETEDRFLKLLVAQMKNQDPLNPLDNAQVTTQLAQINTVKGIDKLNASMSKMLERSNAGSATEAAAMVGRSVLVDGDRLELPEDGVARGGFQLAEAASVARIDVLSAAGTVVDSQVRNNLPAGLQTFQWDGKVGSRTLDPGSYTLRVTAANANRPVEATPLSAAPVQAVVRGADGISLQLGPYGSKPLAEVRGIL